MKYKQIEDNILIGIGISEVLHTGCYEITGEEYNNILSVIASKPEDTETTIYKLHADTLEYVGYDKPPEPVIEPEATVEDYQAALTELGENVSEES